MMALKASNFYYLFTVETYEAKTEKAVLAKINGQNHWLPKSQILAWNDGVNKTVAMGYWMADSKGLLNKNWNGSNAYDFVSWTGEQLHTYLEEHGLHVEMVEA